MKKILSVLFALMLFVLTGVTAFADMGEPLFGGDWYVICGVDGYDFMYDYYDDEKDALLKKPMHIDAGTKVLVYGYFDDEYHLEAPKDNPKYKDIGLFSVSSSDFNKKFYASKKAVGKDRGEKLDKAVEGRVSADVGVVFRQGPGKSFSSYDLVPFNTKVKYQYTYKSDDGLNWGYVTYKGQNGWVCIDYVKEGSEELTTATTTTTTTTTSTSNIDEQTKAAETTNSVEPAKSVNAKTADGFFSNTKNVIIVCCVGAIILALVAIIVMLIIRQNKENNNINMQ